MDEHKVKVRRSESKVRSKSKDKSFNLKKIPKIIFGRSDSIKHEDFEISGVIEGTFSKNVSFAVDNTGTLDLSTVPKEFQEVVQKLFEKVSEQKFLTGDQHDKDEDGNSTPTVVRRKGPRVEKGMKDEEIINEMRSLVNSGDPWDFYAKVSLDPLLDICISAYFFEVNIDYSNLKVPNAFIPMNT